jgi:hypothetical protein
LNEEENEKSSIPAKQVGFNWCSEKTFLIIKQGSMTQLDNPKLNIWKAK